MRKPTLKKANQLCREGEYEEAIVLYSKLLHHLPQLDHVLKQNISFAKLRRERQQLRNQSACSLSGLIHPQRNDPFNDGRAERLLAAEVSRKYFRVVFKNPSNLGGNDKPKALDYRKSILFVAHKANGRLYGGERSFLDIIRCVDSTKYKVVVALPKPDKEYIQELAKYADTIFVTPRLWWSKEKEVCEQLVKVYEKVVRAYQISVVYANTIMLREPLLAADRERVRSVCHVRELISFDQALMDYIGEENSTNIINSVKHRTEYIIANSSATFDLFRKPDATFLVRNTVDTDRFNIPTSSRNDGLLRFGMISSNLRKKGIWDFLAIASACESRFPTVKFVLIGPDSKDLKEAKEQYRAQGGLSNCTFRGYVEDPISAIAEIDVILNLSHFAESFGRTVAEGMAAGRPAIVYNYGALPELVEHGVNGFVVPFKSPLAVMEYIELLYKDPSIYDEMSIAARKSIHDKVSIPSFEGALNSALATIIAGERVPSNGVPAPVKHPTVSVVIPNYNYEQYLEERINSVLKQSYQPLEIIFLDDNSTDNSVHVADNLLNKAGVPYRIIVNDKNQGVFHQWKRGIEIARGEWIWIAEADDRADNYFLETLVSRVEKNTAIVYCQSKRIDGEGRTLVPHNLGHTNDICPRRWRRDYTSAGRHEIVLALAYRNTIPNASAAILRRGAMKPLIEALTNFRSCGDWWLYCNMLKNGDVSFVSTPLNSFRRHSDSQTALSSCRKTFLDEIAEVHRSVASNFRLLISEVRKFEKFVNHDYKVEGITLNAHRCSLSKVISESKEIASGRFRVVFITTNNGSWTGGSEVLWRDAAARLSTLGHDVVALVRRWAPQPRFVDELLRDDVTVLYKEESGFDRIVEIRPDLVIISTGDQDEGTEYFDELIKHNIKYAIVNQLTKEERFWPIRTQKQKAVRNGYTKAARVFFTCKNNHQVMESRLRCALENVAYHFNPFHIDRNKVPPFPDMSHGYRIAVPSKLLYIHKGQDLLLDVLKAEKWKRRPVLVNIYGVGDDRDRMKKSVSELGIENVEFRGRVPDISEIWKENHALLMPSRMEGLPIMLVSAMLSARLAIVTNIGGHAELVENQVSGFIADNPDSASIDKAMEDAWAVRNEWELYGQRARQRVLEFLPEDPVLDFVNKIYDVMECKV